jgi:hypothetical protein
MESGPTTPPIIFDRQPIGLQGSRTLDVVRAFGDPAADRRIIASPVRLVRELPTALTKMYKMRAEC